MVAVLVAAIISAIGAFMPRPLTMFLGERGIGLPVWGYFALRRDPEPRCFLALRGRCCAGPGATEKSRSRGMIVRWLLAAGALALGLAVAHFPLDGLRWANQLKDGNYLCYYHQYRLWPGNQVTPCVETITATGKDDYLEVALLPDLQRHTSSRSAGMADQCRPEHRLDD